MCSLPQFKDIHYCWNQYGEYNFANSWTKFYYGVLVVYVNPVFECCRCEKKCGRSLTLLLCFIVFRNCQVCARVNCVLKRDVMKSAGVMSD